MVLVVSGFSFAKECNDGTLGFSGGRSPTAACGRSHGRNFCRAHNNVFTSILFPVLHKSVGGGKSKKSKKSKNQTDPKAPEKKKKDTGKTKRKNKTTISETLLKKREKETNGSTADSQKTCTAPRTALPVEPSGPMQPLCAVWGWEIPAAPPPTLPTPLHSRCPLSCSKTAPSAALRSQSPLNNPY